MNYHGSPWYSMVVHGHVAIIFAWDVRIFGCRDTSNFVDLPIQFFHFFIPIYDVFIEIHEIVTQIMLMSDFGVTVHCHSIHLIHLLHFWFVNSSCTSDLVCILHFLSICFFDFLCALLIFTNKQNQRFE